MHRLTSITIVVPHVRETAQYHPDFGLLPAKDEMGSELPVKKLLAGMAPDQALSMATLRNPEVLRPFLDFGAR